MIVAKKDEVVPVEFSAVNPVEMPVPSFASTLVERPALNCSTTSFGPQTNETVYRQSFSVVGITSVGWAVGVEADLTEINTRDDTGSKYVCLEYNVSCSWRVNDDENVFTPMMLVARGPILAGTPPGGTYAYWQMLPNVQIHSEAVAGGTFHQRHYWSARGTLAVRDDNLGFLPDNNAFLIGINWWNRLSSVHTIYEMRMSAFARINTTPWQEWQSDV